MIRLLRISKDKILQFTGKNIPVFNIKLNYYRAHKKKLRFKNPKLFSEKLAWLKYYYADNELVIEAADKYGIHGFLEKNNIEDITVPLIAVYDNPNDINFDLLPNQFVIKKSNGSAMNMIVTDKSSINIASFIEEVTKWMNEDFGIANGELHYSKAKSNIVVEQYINDVQKDWKIFFINGIPKMIQVNHWIESDQKNVVGHKSTIRTWTDMNGIVLEIGEDENIINSKFNIGDIIELPNDLSNMIEYGKKVSQFFPMVRVDFFHDGKDRLYLGELTFTPGNASEKFNKNIQEWLGNELILPKIDK